ncbi:MAG: ATP-binding protein [Firmicutes bacterium]|nr:ATP-binding protein [Bacillota bacterium]
MTTGGEDADLGLTELVGGKDRPFVGRWPERRWLATWLDNPEAPSKVLAITGHAGCGKSTLLNYAVSWFEETGRVELLALDARLIPPEPAIIEEKVGASFLARLRGQDEPASKVILAIDTYEAWDRADRWIRENLLKELPATNVLVIMAARGYALDGWRSEPRWTGVFEEFALGPFGREEIEEFLRARRIIDLNWRSVYEMTAGNPLAVALLADLWVRTPANLREGVTVIVADRFSERVFQELNAGVDADLVQVLSLVSEADAATFESLLQRPIARNEIRHLAQLSCVRRVSSGGLALHDTLAPLLREDFRARAPRAYAEMRHRALTHVLREWQNVPDDRRLRLARDLLWLLSDRFEETTQYANLSLADGDLYTTQAQLRDEPAIDRLLVQWGRQSLPLPIDRSQQLIGEVLRSFPEACYVTRNRVGLPVAFHGALWICDETLALLERYCPRFVRQLLEGPWQLGRTPRQEADTLVSVAVGMWIDNSPYFPPQLTGTLIRHSLASHFDARMMLLVQNPALKAFLENLGFQAHPFPLIDEDDSEAMYVLDVRGPRFIQWVEAMTGDALTVGPAEVASDDLGEALRVLWDLERLTQSALARQLGLSGNAVQRLLLRSIETMQADPVQQPFATLLYQAYVAKTREREMTEAWHISRATYYRRLKEALTRLAAWMRASGLLDG